MENMREPSESVTYVATCSPDSLQTRTVSLGAKPENRKVLPSRVIVPCSSLLLTLLTAVALLSSRVNSLTSTAKYSSVVAPALKVKVSAPQVTRGVSVSSKSTRCPFFSHTAKYLGRLAALAIVVTKQSSGSSLKKSLMTFPLPFSSSQAFWLADTETWNCEYHFLRCRP